MSVNDKTAAFWAQVVQDVTAKRCSKCAEMLPRTAFGKDSRTKSGLRSECKKCSVKIQAIYVKTEKRKAVVARYSKSEKGKATQAQYAKSDHGRSVINKRYRERRLTDPQFRIVARLRCRIQHAIRQTKRGGAIKSARTLELLGCSPEFLTEHIEKQFKPGMSWARMGEIHIDHIRPCVSFDLTDPEQQRKCFHFSNLQPLWAAENMEKGARLDF